MKDVLCRKGYVSIYNMYCIKQKVLIFQFIIADLNVLPSLCGINLIGLSLCSSFQRSSSSSSFLATAQVQKETNNVEVRSHPKKHIVSLAVYDSEDSSRNTPTFSEGIQTPLQEVTQSLEQSDGEANIFVNLKPYGKYFFPPDPVS